MFSKKNMSVSPGMGGKRSTNGFIAGASYPTNLLCLFFFISSVRLWVKIPIDLIFKKSEKE